MHGLGCSDLAADVNPPIFADAAPFAGTDPLLRSHIGEESLGGCALASGGRGSWVPRHWRILATASTNMEEEERTTRIEFKLEGASRDEGLVRFSDFAAFVEGALATLRALERAETKSRRARIDYRITQLEVGSAVLAIEAVGGIELRQTEQRVALRFAQGLAAVRSGLDELAGIDPAVRDAMSRMLAPLGRGVKSINANVAGVTLSLTGKVPSLLPAVGAGAESAAMGSFTGSIDALNVHDEPFFYLYPAAGPSRIKCVFDVAKLEKVREAVKRFTTVSGLIEFSDASPFPQRIIVEDVVALPDAASLPDMKSLWGKYPELTRGLDAVAFVDSLRDA